MKPDTKSKCTDYRCGWFGKDEDVLIAKNPFDPDDFVTGCPLCKQINTITYACDEEGCWADATCGTPTAAGYRRTCGKHMPKANKESL